MSLRSLSPPHVSHEKYFLNTHSCENLQYWFISCRRWMSLWLSSLIYWVGHLSITVVKHHSQGNVQKEEFISVYRTRWRVHTGGGGKAAGSQSRGQITARTTTGSRERKPEVSLWTTYVRPSVIDFLQQVCTSFSFPEQENQRGPGVQMSGQWGIFLFQTATFTLLNFPGLVLHPDSPCLFLCKVSSPLFCYLHYSHLVNPGLRMLFLHPPLTSVLLFSEPRKPLLSCLAISLLYADWT